jgi:hypothetical protein
VAAGHTFDKFPCRTSVAACGVAPQAGQNVVNSGMLGKIRPQIGSKLKKKWGIYKYFFINISL